MQASRSRRKRHSAEERSQLIGEYWRSGLTQREFAVRSRIGVSTLHAWLRRAGTEERPGGVQLISLPSLAPAAPACRIGFPGGMTLEVPAGFRSEEVTFLVQMLRSL